jgi:hypothetical protein
MLPLLLALLLALLRGGRLRFRGASGGLLPCAGGGLLFCGDCGALFLAAPGAGRAYKFLSMRGDKP